MAGKRVTGLSPEAAERLLSYSWPGNVRELQNAIERAVALAQYDQVMVDDLPEKIRAYRPSHVLIAADDPSELVPLEVAERRYILRVLESVGGNKTLAARVLGIGRRRSIGSSSSTGPPAGRRGGRPAHARTAGAPAPSGG